MRRFVCLLILMLYTPACLFAAEESATGYQLKLDEIRGKISDLLSNLTEKQGKYTDLRKELQKLEITIAKVSVSLRSTQKKHTDASNRLSQHQTELEDLNRQLNRQRGLLAGQIRAAYTLGQQPELKLVFNQQSPTEMGRAMVYFDYLNRARSHEINAYLESIRRQQQLKTDIAATLTELEQLATEQTRQKNQLTAHRNSRKELLDRLSHDIEQQKLALNDLESSRTRIEKLLQSLGEIMADIPPNADDQHPFASLKGKLPWPVRGKFVADFGSRRGNSDLKWSGVVINAAYGTPVRAVNHGRVVFADWLQGFGFITILDHNDGFMTLYGHNQALLKEAGDWVEAGETIATVGDSGGQETSGLYFEIRSQGKPVDPEQWCSSSVKHVAVREN
jgi:septal ring factor EnvC (AmiA/AmiB activator)